MTWGARELPPDFSWENMNDTIDHLNKWLLNREGRSLDGHQLYRLVWSDSCFENRYGTFREFAGDLFIREVTGVRLVPKYNYIRERYIFEKWAPGSMTQNSETPDAANGDYIPVYVFESSNRKFLEPNKKVLTFLLDFMRGQIRTDREIPQELQDEKEIQYAVDSMDTHPMFSTSGETRDSVAYTRELKDKEWPSTVQ